nr:alpha-amylase family glycosyl hydrolase [Paenibacillus sp. DMB20]
MRKLKPMNLKQWGALAASTIVLGGLLAACGDGGQRNTAESQTPATKTQEQRNKPPSSKTNVEIDEQPSDVYYEIFVRSFYDSDGDGIGDLKGVIEKLDYLNDGNSETEDDLGVTGIWLMPVNPSPSYHGYDVTDYRSIHPDYGTIEDFRTLTAEAHKRGIKVIMDLVVNHTSSEHPWFKEAADDKNSEKRDWYVWAEDQGKEAAGSSAAGSGNPWHEMNGTHYMGTFWSGMPDLNFDNPKVREEMKDTGKFWLEQGADGFRLDAAKHIYEDLATDKSEATTAKKRRLVAGVPLRHE